MGGGASGLPSEAEFLNDGDAQTWTECLTTGATSSAFDAKGATNSDGLGVNPLSPCAPSPALNPVNLERGKRLR